MFIIDINLNFKNLSKQINIYRIYQGIKFKKRTKMDNEKCEFNQCFKNKVWLKYIINIKLLKL